MKKNVIYAGDCNKVMPNKIKSNSIDLVFADPPFNVSDTPMHHKKDAVVGEWTKFNNVWGSKSEHEYIEFTRDWITNCQRVLKSNGSIYVTASYHNLGEILSTLKNCEFKVNNIITRHKSNAFPNLNRRTYQHSTEFIVYAVKGSNWTFNYDVMREINPMLALNGNKKQMRDMWEMPSVTGFERIKDKKGKSLHPTQKPIEMLRRIILASSNPGDTILDPFMGSGTSLFVAMSNKRNFIGIENNNKFVKHAQRRLGLDK